MLGEILLKGIGDKSGRFCGVNARQINSMLGNNHVEIFTLVPLLFEQKLEIRSPVPTGGKLWSYLALFLRRVTQACFAAAERFGSENDLRVVSAPEDDWACDAALVRAAFAAAGVVAFEIRARRRPRDLRFPLRNFGIDGGDPFGGGSESVQPFAAGVSAVGGKAASSIPKWFWTSSRATDKLSKLTTISCDSFKIA